MHMVQHLLLTMVAAPLVLLGNPLPVVLWGVPREPRRWLAYPLTSTTGFRKATAQSTAFGALLALPERSFHPYYDRIASHLGANAAGEQAAAGGIMWVSGHMYLFPILLVLYNFAQRNARVEAR